MRLAPVSGYRTVALQALVFVGGIDTTNADRGSRFVRRLTGNPQGMRDILSG
jgi:hypothetical protein